MRERFSRFMYGRYGQDELCRLLNIAAVILCILSLFTGWAIPYLLALALLLYSFFRSFSRNTQKRYAEYQAYERLKNRIFRFFSGIKTRFAHRKTHRYFACPNCRQQLRVPKGKGRVSVTCPKCHTAFERKS